MFSFKENNYFQPNFIMNGENAQGDNLFIYSINDVIYFYKLCSCKSGTEYFKTIRKHKYNQSPAHND